MNRKTIVGAILVVTGVTMAVEARAQQAAPFNPRVYTVCMLLAGKRNAQAASGTAANALKKDGSAMTEQVAAGTNPLTPAESKQVERDLAELREKLKTSFQLERVEVVASRGDWMPVGHEMLLQGQAAGLKLQVTATGVATSAEPPMVASTPRNGGEPSGYEQGYARGVNAVSRAAEYQVKLTAGTSVVLDRWMKVVLGQRSVFARQPQPNGPVYFAVVTAPLMETGQGVATGGIVGQPLPIKGPRLVSGPDPLLPADVQARIKGTLVLRATIGIDGSVRAVRVSEPAEGVTERAVAALRLRRYEPARDEAGRPVTVQIVVAVKASGEP